MPPFAMQRPNSSPPLRITHTVSKEHRTLKSGQLRWRYTCMCGKVGKWHKTENGPNVGSAAHLRAIRTGLHPVKYGVPEYLMP